MADFTRTFTRKAILYASLGNTGCKYGTDLMVKLVVKLVEWKGSENWRLLKILCLAIANIAVDRVLNLASARINAYFGKRKGYGFQFRAEKVCFC